MMTLVYVCTYVPMSMFCLTSGREGYQPMGTLVCLIPKSFNIRDEHSITQVLEDR
jgi:hypothetical protein